MLVIEMILILAPVDNRLQFYWFFYCIGIILGGGINDKIHYWGCFLALGVFVLVSVKLGNEIETLSFVASGSFVVFVINMGKILEKTILSKLMCIISYASMCAYLFHRPFYYYLMQWRGYFPIWAAYVVILPILIVLCYGIQWLYDKFVQQIINSR